MAVSTGDRFFSVQAVSFLQRAVFESAVRGGGNLLIGRFFCDIMLMWNETRNQRERPPLCVFARLRLNARRFREIDMLPLELPSMMATLHKYESILDSLALKTLHSTIDDKQPRLGVVIYSATKRFWCLLAELHPPGNAACRRIHDFDLLAMYALHAIEQHEAGV